MMRLDALEELTRPELQDLCRKAGIKLGGSKGEIIDRLDRHYAGQGNEEFAAQLQRTQLRRLLTNAGLGVDGRVDDLRVRLLDNLEEDWPAAHLTAFLNVPKTSLKELLRKRNRMARTEYQSVIGNRRDLVHRLRRSGASALWVIRNLDADGVRAAARAIGLDPRTPVSELREMLRDDAVEHSDIEPDSPGDAPGAQRRSGAALAMIRTRLDRADPLALEEFIAQLLNHSGYEDVMLTPASKDRGIDLKCFQTNSDHRVRVPYFVQVKRWTSKNVGYNEVRQLHVAIRHESEKSPLRNAWGIFITTGGFTKDVREHQDEFPEIRLVDGDELARWIHDHNLAEAIPEPFI